MGFNIKLKWSAAYPGVRWWDDSRAMLPQEPCINRVLSLGSCSPLRALGLFNRARLVWNDGGQNATLGAFRDRLEILRSALGSPPVMNTSWISARVGRDLHTWSILTHSHTVLGTVMWVSSLPPFLILHLNPPGLGLGYSSAEQFPMRHWAKIPGPACKRRGWKENKQYC